MRWLLWTVAGLVFLGSGALVAGQGGHWETWTERDWGTWALTVTVLVLTSVTIDQTIFAGPRLWIGKPDELGYSDLIFYLVDHEGQRVPRDFLLQLHVLVANVGARKAVVTRVRVTQFKDANGKTVKLPEMPGEMAGQHYSTWFGGPALQGQLHGQTRPPPYIVDAGECLVLRFRGRRNVAWTKDWTIDRLKAFHAALADEPTAATVEIQYRFGKLLRTSVQDVPLVVEQHGEYTTQLNALTRGFTVLPKVPEMRIDIE